MFLFQIWCFLCQQDRRDHQETYFTGACFPRESFLSPYRVFFCFLVGSYEKTVTSTAKLPFIKYSQCSLCTSLAWKTRAENRATHFKSPERWERPQLTGSPEWVFTGLLNKYLLHHCETTQSLFLHPRSVAVLTARIRNYQEHLRKNHKVSEKSRVINILWSSEMMSQMMGTLTAAAALSCVRTSLFSFPLHLLFEAFMCYRISCVLPRNEPKYAWCSCSRKFPC